MDILHAVNTVVLLRRALRVIMGEGYPNTTAAFTQKLRKESNPVPVWHISNPL